MHAQSEELVTFHPLHQKANTWRQQKRKCAHLKLGHTQDACLGLSSGGRLLHCDLESPRTQVTAVTKDLRLRLPGCSFKDKIMDDNLLFIREAQSVFADKVTVKAYSSWILHQLSIHKLIFSLQALKKKKKKILLQGCQPFVLEFSYQFLMFAISHDSQIIFKLGSQNYWYTHIASCWGQWLLYFIVKHNHYVLAPLIYVTLPTKKGSLL